MKKPLRFFTRSYTRDFLKHIKLALLKTYRYSSVGMFLILLFAASLESFAQDGDKHERIKALKVSFITEKLELSSAEAEKFWPVYNTYDSQIHDLRHKERQLFKEKYSSDGVKNKFSESESEKLIKTYIEVRDQRHLLEKQLMYALIKKLPASKIVFLPEVEDDFSRMLFEEYKKRKEKEKP